MRAYPWGILVVVSAFLLVACGATLNQGPAVTQAIATAQREAAIREATLRPAAVPPSQLSRTSAPRVASPAPSAPAPPSSARIPTPRPSAHPSATPTPVATGLASLNGTPSAVSSSRSLAATSSTTRTPTRADSTAESRTASPSPSTGPGMPLTVELVARAVTAGETSTVVAHTLPRTSCGLTVAVPLMTDPSENVATKQSDRDGRISWRWTAPSSSFYHSVHLVVRCTATRYHAERTLTVAIKR